MTTPAFDGNDDARRHMTSDNDDKMAMIDLLSIIVDGDPIRG
jgi:hypothetical protein